MLKRGASTGFIKRRSREGIFVEFLRQEQQADLVNVLTGGRVFVAKIC